MSTAAVSEGYKVEVPTKDRTGEYFIFFAGDAISDEVKATNPGWEAGGNLYPGVLTLGYRLGYVRKCEITGLRQAMVPENPQMVHPDKREFKVGQYLIHEGDTIRPSGANGMLHTPVYPVDEIDRLTGQVDGLVRMPCDNAQEATAAQYFLFPNWNDFVRGQDDAGETVTLPKKLSQLKAYFELRQKAAQSTFQTAVAMAAIKSCDELTNWCANRAKWANDTYESMKTKGHTWSYGADAEQAFKMTGLQRRDQLLQEQATKADDLSGAVAGLANTVDRLVKHQIGQTPDAGQGVDFANDAPPKIEGTDETISYEELAKFREWQEKEQREDTKAKKELRAIFDGREVVVTNTNHMGKIRLRDTDGQYRIVEKSEVIFPDENENA
jgi:hypothetical protein